MLSRIKNIFAIPDLRNRVLFTLGMLAVYRIGAQIPTPGVNGEALSALFKAEGGIFGVRVVDCSSEVVIGASLPPACSKVIFTGPTPYTHQTVRTPLPYGSPSAPACVVSVRTFAARTPSGNAGTLTDSVPS